MTPEALGHLDKARNSLAKASGMIDIGYCDEAGRCAYLAAFHAALAFIFEQTGKAPKTHAGVRGQFGNLTKNDPRFDVSLKKFLSQAYEMKTVADYDMVTDVSVERALEAIKMATRFVDCIICGHRLTDESRRSNLRTQPSPSMLDKLNPNPIRA